MILFPISLFIGVESGDGVVFQAKLPLVEPMIWALFTLWLLQRLKDLGKEPFHLIPLPVSAFYLILCLSTIVSKGFFSSLKEMIQYTDYYILF